MALKEVGQLLTPSGVIATSQLVRRAQHPPQHPGVKSGSTMATNTGASSAAATEAAAAEVTAEAAAREECHNAQSTERNPCFAKHSSLIPEMTSTPCLAVLALALCVCTVSVEAGLTVYGNCLDGAQCAGRGLEGGYPVCCRGQGQRPLEVSKLFEFGSTVYLMCRCPVADTANRVQGNCWQGSQCNACSSASMINGHWVCCPNCSGVTIINGRCYC